MCSLITHDFYKQHSMVICVHECGFLWTLQCCDSIMDLVDQFADWSLNYSFVLVGLYSTLHMSEFSSGHLLTHFQYIQFNLQFFVILHSIQPNVVRGRMHNKM